MKVRISSADCLVLALALAGGSALPGEALAAPSSTPQDAMREASGATWTSVSGEPLAPLGSNGTAFSVLIFITTDCPIANAFVPEINRLTDDLTARGGTVTLVQVDWDLSPDKARAHAADYQIVAPVLIDRDHVLVRATGASVTPEAVLLAPDQQILYRGRINDLFAGYGDRRRAPTRHDLRVAVDEFLAGEPVSQPAHPALGCYIPDRPKS